MPPPNGLIPMMQSPMKLGGPDIPGDQGGGLGSMMPTGQLAVSDKDTSPATPGGDTVSQDTVGGATQTGGTLGPALAQGAMKIATPTNPQGPVPGVTGGVK